MPAPVFTIINFDKADNPYTITGEGYVQKLGQLSANFTSLADYMAEVELTVESAAANLGQAVTDALNANPTESAMEAFLSLFLSTTFTAGTDYLAPDGDGGQLTNLNPSAIAAATTTTPGVTQLKTSHVSASETEAATPKSVKQAYDALNLAKQDALETVSQEEAEAGTSTTARKWTPLRVRQAVEASASNNSFVASTAIVQGKACILNSDGTASQSKIAATAYGTLVNATPVNTSTASTICYDPPTGKFLHLWVDSSDSNKGKGRVGTVSGTTLTYGDVFTFSASTLYTASASGLTAVYDEDTGQIIVSYVVASILKLMAITVNSDSTVSMGAEYNTVLDNHIAGICYDTSINKIVCNNYFSSTNKINVFTVSGTSFTLEATTTMEASGTNGYTASIAHMKGYGTDGWNVATFNSSGQGKVRIVKINVTTFAATFGTAYVPVHNAYGTSGYIQGNKALAWSEAFQRLLVLSDSGPSTYYLMVNMLQVSATDYWAVTASSLTISAGFFSAPYEKFYSIAIAPNNNGFSIAYPDLANSSYARVAVSSSFTTSSMSVTLSAILQSSAIGWTNIEYSGDSLTAMYSFSIVSNIQKAGALAAPFSDRRTQFIGFAQNTVSLGGTVEVKTMAAVDDNQSGLTPGTLYYLSSTDGSTVTATVSGPIVGKAISATGILVGTNSI